MLNANVLLFQQNDQWQDGTIQITSSSLCKNPDTRPKSNPSTPICTTHSRSVGAWTAMFSEALHRLTFIAICLAPKKKISFYCIICRMILLFHVVSTFPTNHCKSCHNALAVVSNMQRMPKISPLFPVAKAGQVEMHFADLQTLATMLLSHRNAVHPLTEHDNICLEFEFQIRKGKPEIMPLRVVDLRNIDYG